MLPDVSALSPLELERFLAVVRGRRHKHASRNLAFFLLLATAGVRPAEALRLRARHVRRTVEAKVRLWVDRPRCRRYPAARRTLLLTGELGLLMLERVRRLERHARLFRFTIQQARRLFAYHARRSGMRPGLTLFSLRHTAGVRLWQASRSTRFVQRVLGLARPEFARAYAHIHL